MVNVLTSFKILSNSLIQPLKFISTKLTVRNYAGLDYEPPEESYQKTTVELISKKSDKHPLLLTGYGIGKFRFSGLSLRGSVAITEKAIFKWKVTDPSEITTASMALFYMLHPKLEFVVIGTGNSYYPIQPEILAVIRERGIGVEVQDTIHACGTYNLLKSDKPNQIGAALIPITDNKLIVRSNSKFSQSMM